MAKKKKNPIKNAPDEIVAEVFDPQSSNGGFYATASDNLEGLETPADTSKKVGIYKLVGLGIVRTGTCLERSK